MASIRKLDNDVARCLQSQITIKDITHVIKELLENSVDAGATRISLGFKMKDTFQVWCKDNGSGLTPKDMKRVGGRSCTSKFFSNYVEDLTTAQTLGFRGEALNSIINVCSRLEIISRTRAHNSAYKVTFLKGKKIEDVHLAEVSGNLSTIGTLVTVSNIFGNTPVRFKYLEKSSGASTIDEIRRVVFNLSVSNPKVDFKIYKILEDGKELLLSSVAANSSQSSAGIANIFRAVYGLSVADEYESLEAEFENYKIKGIIGLTPARDRSFQFVLMNRRQLLNESLFKEINGIFLKSGLYEHQGVMTPNFSRRDLSPKKGKSPVKAVGQVLKKYPVFVFIIACKQSLSDLLQDPSKSVHESKHIDVVQALIMRLLNRYLRKQRVKLCSEENIGSISEDFIDKARDIGLKKSPLKLMVSTNSKTSRILDNEIVGRTRPGGTICVPLGSSDVYSLKTSFSNLDHAGGVTKIDPCKTRSVHFNGASTVHLSPTDFKEFSVIGQVDNKFILFSIPKAVSNHALLLIIDQHACDERIKFEMYLKEFIEQSFLNPESENVVCSKLEKPLSLEFSSQEVFILKDLHTSFTRWGILFEFIQGGNVVEITHMPPILASKGTKDASYLKEVLMQHCFDLRNHRKLKAFPNKTDDWWGAMACIPDFFLQLFSSKACRSAIMFGEELNNEQCFEYISKLKDCNLPFQCAHGRPSVVPLLDLSIEL